MEMQYEQWKQAHDKPTSNNANSAITGRILRSKLDNSREEMKIFVKSMVSSKT